MTHRFLLLCYAALVAGGAAFGAVHLLKAASAPQVLAQDVAVSATEFAFDPSLIQVAPGEVMTVVLTNDGRAPHDITFNLDGGRVEQSATIRGAEVVTLSFDAPMMEGEYKYFCSVGNHEAQGMVGTLRVGDPPASFAVVADDLLNPRGLAVSGDLLLVGEGGTGTEGTGFRPGNNDGRVTMLSISDPTSRTVLADDLTNAVDPGGGVIGANHALWDAGELLFALSGGPGHPDPKAKVVSVPPGGEPQELFDLWEFEEQVNPDEGEIDSNPWRIQPADEATIGGRWFERALFVSDSGGNSVVRVQTGRCSEGFHCLSLYAVFEPVGERDNGAPISAVPTGLAWDEATGELYVALLGSVVEGEAQVRRLVDTNEDGDALDEGENTLVLDGLTMAVDLAFSPSGRLYVLEFGGSTAQGRLTEVTKTGPGVVVEGLQAASALAFDVNGDALVAVGDASSGRTTSRVVRVPAERFNNVTGPPTPTPTSTPTEPAPGTFQVFLPLAWQR